jgi:ribosomal protein S27E
MADDKIKCPNCGKMITPQIVFRNGDADKAICKLCGETIWTKTDGVLLGLLAEGIDFIISKIKK